MIVSINQPAYLPWLGYFDRIRRSDLHIVLDHVQFEKGSYTNRCRIKQPDGREMWLTIPVGKHRTIYTTGIAGDKWRDKHKKALEQAYGLWVVLPDSHWLDIVLAETTHQLCKGLHIDTPRVTSTGLGGEEMGHKSELVLELCRNVGADQYLSGPHGRDYLDIPAFTRAGIEVLYHDYPSDGDNGLSAVHHLFTGAVKWAKTSLDYSPPSEAAGAYLVDQDPADQHQEAQEAPTSELSWVAADLLHPARREGTTR